MFRRLVLGSGPQVPIPTPGVQQEGMYPPSNLAAPGLSWQNPLEHYAIRLQVLNTIMSHFAALYNWPTLPLATREYCSQIEQNYYYSSQSLEHYLDLGRLNAELSVHSSRLVPGGFLISPQIGLGGPQPLSLHVPTISTLLLPVADPYPMPSHNPETQLGKQPPCASASPSSPVSSPQAEIRGLEITRVKNVTATSKFRGVSFNSQTKKWKAVITVKGSQRFLGYFPTELQAAQAYDDASKKYRGERAHVNFYDTKKIRASADDSDMGTMSDGGGMQTGGDSEMRDRKLPGLIRISADDAEHDMGGNEPKQL